MPASQSANIAIVRGDAFSLAVALGDGASASGFPIVATDPAGATITVLGEYAATFPSGTLFRIAGNAGFAANAVWTSNGATESGGKTVIALPTPTNYAVADVDTLADSFDVSGDRRLVFYPGAFFFLTGNAGAAANRQYTVSRSSYNGTNTTVVAVEDVPEAATVSGNLTVPAVPPTATATGEVRRVADSPVDITDYTIAAQIRNGRGSSATLIADFTIAKTDAAAGEFTLSLTEEETAALSAGEYLWDARLDDGEGTQYRLPSDGAGGVRILDEVTQA